VICFGIMVKKKLAQAAEKKRPGVQKQGFSWTPYNWGGGAGG